MWLYSYSPWISHLPNLDNSVESLEATCVFGLGMVLTWARAGIHPGLGLQR